MKRRCLIIGFGMMGASLGSALSRCGYEVLAADGHQPSLDFAVKEGIASGTFSTLNADFVTSSDIVILAVPMLALAPLKPFVAQALEQGAYVTDLCSVKGFVYEQYGDLTGVERLVPGHPIAGSEHSGAMAYDGQLFAEQTVILTPSEHTDVDAVQFVKTLWQHVGAKVALMSAQYHDEVLAKTSHLPHFLAFALVDGLAGDVDNRDIFQYAAGGFRDFTRIAASDPRMWHDIAQTNKEAVINALDVVLEKFSDLRDAIAQDDSKYIKGVFTRSQVARNHFSAVLQQRSYRQNKERSMDFIAKHGGSVKGEIRVPGDKSCSHRSIMLGALADGVTHVTGFLEGEDALATLQAFRDMGVVIEGPDRGEVTIHGVGIDGLKAPVSDLYMGNSGTTIRLMSGILAGQSFAASLTGDASLSKRPMRRVTVPLGQMGAQIEAQDDGTPPLNVAPAQQLKGIHYDLPIASAQVKSAVLLAGLFAEGETSVTEPAPTRDHTERMLRGFGYDVVTEGNRISLQGGQRLTACDVDVPGDISSAAFFLVAASITPGADLLLKHVGINPTRIGVINILRAMGGDITLQNERLVGGEPVADIRVKYAQLKGINIDEADVPLAIDEFPVLFVAASCAEGQTVLTGAEELRVKESDRIQVMADGLNALGVDAVATPDGMVINGGPIGGGEVASHDDHRIAMAFSVASLRATGDIVIRDADNVATSFPNFVELANEVGFNILVDVNE